MIAAPSSGRTARRIAVSPAGERHRDTPGRSRCMLTDEEVVARVQAGEVELFEIIFDRHYARIERYVRGLGTPDAELEDVVADAFTRAFARIRSFDSASGTRYVSYLYAIARNLATDRLRERMRAPEVTFLEDVRATETP